MKKKKKGVTPKNKKDKQFALVADLVFFFCAFFVLFFRFLNFFFCFLKTQKHCLFVFFCFIFPFCRKPAMTNHPGSSPSLLNHLCRQFFVDKVIQSMGLHTKTGLDVFGWIFLSIDPFITIFSM